MSSDPIQAMKTKHTAGLTTVVLLLIVRATPGLAQEGSQAQSVEELAKLKQNPVSELRQVSFQPVIGPDVPDSGKAAGVCIHSSSISVHKNSVSRFVAGCARLQFPSKLPLAAGADQRILEVPATVHVGGRPAATRPPVPT